MTERPIDPDHAVHTSASVTARTAQGQPYGEGKVIAYCDRPTFVIERPDGTRFSWMADMAFETEPPLPLVELPDTGAIRLSDSSQILYFAETGPGEVVTGSSPEEAVAKREEGRRWRKLMTGLVEERS